MLSPLVGRLQQILSSFAPPTLRNQSVELPRVESNTSTNYRLIPYAQRWMADQQPKPSAKYDGDRMKLHPAELPWRDRYDVLKDHGYLLRPRYRPGWTASWPDSQEFPNMRYEDALIPSHSKRLDAERVSDGKPVFLKLAPKSSPEINIGRIIASKELLQDPRNRCAPLLDVLDDPVNPEGVILVFPLLRRLDHPMPTTIGEFVPMVQQTLEVRLSSAIRSLNSTPLV
ncbi:hypothetical protein FRC01_001590 [Tulasnella sp. 417]|nr:hypothetical protein FRC01_001590 [Tulasnella sp. 417]